MNLMTAPNQLKMLRSLKLRPKKNGKQLKVHEGHYLSHICYYKYYIENWGRKILTVALMIFSNQTIYSPSLRNICHLMGNP